MPAAKCPLCHRPVAPTEPYVITFGQVFTHFDCLVAETRTLLELFVLVLPKSA